MVNEFRKTGLDQLKGDELLEVLKRSPPDEGVRLREFDAYLEPERLRRNIHEPQIRRPDLGASTPDQ